MEMTEFNEVLEGRASVRNFDPEFKVSEDVIKELIMKSVTAPSSNNLQPWHFIVVNDQNIKEELLPLAFNQNHVVDASAVIVVVGDREGYKRGDEMLDMAVEAGAMPVDFRNMMSERIKQTYGTRPAAALQGVAMFDCGLVSMQMMLIAKEMGLDTLPIGGFDREKVAQYFEMKENQFPVLLLALGKAKAEAAKGKIRFPIEDTISWNKL